GARRAGRRGTDGGPAPPAGDRGRTARPETPSKRRRCPPAAERSPRRGESRGCPADGAGPSTTACRRPPGGRPAPGDGARRDDGQKGDGRVARAHRGRVGYCPGARRSRAPADRHRAVLRRDTNGTRTPPTRVTARG